MNKYSYDDIKVGMKASYKACVSKKYQELFRQQTKDINPLHSDVKFAQSKGYDKEVVFGMLTASFYSTIAGVYLPGENSLIHSVDVKFIKPVFIGDKLEITGEVKEKNDLFKFFTIKAVIRNQNNEKVSKAIMKVGVLDG